MRDLRDREEEEGVLATSALTHGQTPPYPGTPSLWSLKSGFQRDDGIFRSLHVLGGDSFCFQEAAGSKAVGIVIYRQRQPTPVSKVQEPLSTVQWGI